MQDQNTILASFSLIHSQNEATKRLSTMAVKSARKVNTRHLLGRYLLSLLFRQLRNIRAEGTHL
jgi:hypothetical protein